MNGYDGDSLELIDSDSADSLDSPDSPDSPDSLDSLDSPDSLGCIMHNSQCTILLVREQILSQSCTYRCHKASQARNLYISFVLKFLRQQALRPRSGNFARVWLRRCFLLTHLTHDVGGRWNVEGGTSWQHVKELVLRKSNGDFCEKQR